MNKFELFFFVCACFCGKIDITKELLFKVNNSAKLSVFTMLYNL